MKFLLIILIFSGIKIQENHAVVICLDFEGQNCHIDGDCGLLGKCVVKNLGWRSCECKMECRYGTKCDSDDECGEKGKCAREGSVKRCKCKEECRKGATCLSNEQCGENGICDRTVGGVGSCLCFKPVKKCISMNPCLKDEHCGKTGKCESWTGVSDVFTRFCQCPHLVGVGVDGDCYHDLDCMESNSSRFFYGCKKGKCRKVWRGSGRCSTHDDCMTGVGWYCDFENGSCAMDPNEGKL